LKKASWVGRRCGRQLLLLRRRLSPVVHRGMNCLHQAPRNVGAFVRCGPVYRKQRRVFALFHPLQRFTVTLIAALVVAVAVAVVVVVVAVAANAVVAVAVAVVPLAIAYVLLSSPTLSHSAAGVSVAVAVVLVAVAVAANAVIAVVSSVACVAVDVADVIVAVAVALVAVAQAPRSLRARSLTISRLPPSCCGDAIECAAALCASLDFLGATSRHSRLRGLSLVLCTCTSRLLRVLLFALACTCPCTCVCCVV
jgi:hypothetical protein